MKFPDFKYRLGGFSLSLIILLCFNPLHASTVFEVGLNEMIANAEFVFEGEVIQVKSRQRAGGGAAIHTFVTFRILETIKGTYPMRNITLRFLGGKVGDLSLNVSEMKIPALQEKGIYFVESLKRHQVNPLFGWSQGHLLVKPDKTGRERVFCNNQRPITSVESDPFGKERGRKQRAFSRGIARGLIIGKARDASRALSAKGFKKTLRRKMEGLK